ncbi:MAG TPA: CHAT domain-containing protein [Sphingomicrobium sp.]|nr:CHAT domain-containing protein [Sphingomicrobium sp.]
MRKARIVLAALVCSIGLTPPGPAAPLSVRDSFRIGTSGLSYCSGQPVANDPALTGMFDAGYSVTCRDAALPVGKLYLLRSGDNPEARLAAIRGEKVSCGASKPGSVEGLGSVEIIDCTMTDANVGYRVYEYRKGDQLFVAEGLTGYDSALQLGLRSIVADEIVEGEVSIATTGAGDPAAFARVQAGTLDPTRALAEAYRRNNVGSYADAAEFFAAVSSSGDAPISRAEALINEALQKSNLGRFAEADALFSRAAEQVRGDPIDGRRFRNYRAMHLLNLGNPEEALKELDKPMPKFASAGEAGGKTQAAIDSAMSKRLNSESTVAAQLGAASDELLPEEKAEILDGQALQLRGTSLRLSGNLTAATQALHLGDAKLEAVRGGRVASIAWMRAQILGDLAAIAEQSGNASEADSLYRQGVAILELNYPGSAALLNARARLAGYFARAGNLREAETMFRDIVHSQADANNLPPSFARVLRPYVDILLKKGGDAATTAEIFAASQLMMRPGLAQTQAVLARELSGGTGEAARLFRQAVTLGRQVERTRINLAHLEQQASPSPADIAKAQALRTDLEQSQKESLATQAALAGFPRYRAVSVDVIPLADLQKALRPGEGYYRMTIVDDNVYALLATPTAAQAVKLPVTATALEQEVDSLRETISTVEQGQQITYPYDVALAHKLYEDLFGPVAAHLGGITHLVFEPDGAMLRMPPNPLVVDQASVDLYSKRVQANPDAEFDFRGINWFGRDRDISTAVSPRSFVELRNAPPAAGHKLYLGLGHNTPPASNEARLVPAAADRDCILPLSSWERPISGKELTLAGDIMSRMDPNGVQIVTGDGFTDTAIEERTDLNQYRIIHFATHGVVTAPRAKCPTQPALLTSFGGDGSDGLLTFRDIFDLNLDADIVILSACDTAGKATAVATQEVGLGTGGDVALDGLVRAFVGAGGRLVIASHWPVPDDFNATQRLVTGLFTAPAGTPTVTALRQSERQLMDSADTSHPFYWSAFAAVGDGDIPVIRAKTQIAEKH